MLISNPEHVFSIYLISIKKLPDHCQAVFIEKHFNSILQFVLSGAGATPIHAIVFHRHD